MTFEFDKKDCKEKKKRKKCNFFQMKLNCTFEQCFERNVGENIW